MKKMDKIPQINYLAPVVNIAIGDHLFTEISHLEIDAACPAIAASCLLTIPDLSNELHSIFTKGDKITVSWGYCGRELERIFTGILQGVEEYKSEIYIKAIDMAALLYDKHITCTYQNETPSTIITSMLKEAGISDFDVDEVNSSIERLPLVNNNIIEAIYLINRNVEVKHNFWFDQDGKFYWKTNGNDNADHSGYMLEWGKNIISLTKLHAGTTKLSTIGLPLFHSKFIDIINKENINQTFCIKRVKHNLGPNKRGSRTFLWLEEVLR